MRKNTSMASPVARVAAIHDLSGLGRVALTALIPIFAIMGIQVCPLPTAVLSSETGGFDDFEFVDLTAAMPRFLAHWKRLDMRFEAVYSGFLGSPEQVDTVLDCIDSCLASDGLVIVDPVLGDDGELYNTMCMEMVSRMRDLVTKAHCITPNITEAALLLQRDIPTELSTSQLKAWLQELAELGPKMVVITSVPAAAHICRTVAYDKQSNEFWAIDCEYIPQFFSGTGDIFASVLTANLLLGEGLALAMDRAAHFVTMGMRTTLALQSPPREGIVLERVLPSLMTPPVTARFYSLQDGI